MANRYDKIGDITSLPNTSVSPTLLPGQNRYNTLNNITPTIRKNRYDNLDSVVLPISNIPQQEEGFFDRAGNKIGGLFGTAGKILSTGQYTQVGASEKLLEKTGVLKPTGIEGTGIKAGIEKEKSNVELLKRIGEETGKGSLLTGRYTPSQSVLSNFVKELPVTTLGVAGDVLLDPLGYIYKPIKYGIKATGILPEIAKGAKAVKEYFPAVDKAADALGRQFLLRYKQRPEFVGTDVQRKIDEALAIEDVGKLTSPIIEKPAHIQQRIAQVIKGGITSRQDIESVARPIRQELDRVGESISKLNPKLLSEETFTKNKGTYFPRLYDNYEFPTEEQAITQFFGERATTIPKDRFKQRLSDFEMAKTIDPKITDTDLFRIKQLAEQARSKLGEIKEAGLPAVKGLTQLRIVEQRQKFFNDISKLSSDEPKPGWIQMSDDKVLGNLVNKFLPAAEFEQLTRFRKVPTQLEKTYLNALTLWKQFKTAWNPSTSSRNALTNFFILNPLGSVGPHRLDLYAKTIKELKTKGQFYQMARKEGLNLSTQAAAELKANAERLYKSQKGIINKFFPTLKDFHQAAVNFYGSQDKFFKLANFIKGVTEDGLTSTQAMKRANTYLVDYSEVPPVIDWLRKSPVGIPFISFTYGVSKSLAKTLLENPQRLAAYYKILVGIQQMNPEGETREDIANETNVLPDWIYENTYLRLPVKDKLGAAQYINLEYILPFNILETEKLSPQSPVFNILTSLFQNQNTFTGKDITLSTDTVLEKAEKHAKYIFQQLAPSLAFVPFTDISGFSANKIENWWNNRPDYKGYVRTSLQVFMDVLGGIKITPIDQSIEASKRAYEKQKELIELQGQLKKIYLDKRIFPQEKEEQAKDIREKIQKRIQQR